MSEPTQSPRITIRLTQAAMNAVRKRAEKEQSTPSAVIQDAVSAYLGVKAGLDYTFAKMPARRRRQLAKEGAARSAAVRAKKKPDES